MIQCQNQQQIAYNTKLTKLFMYDTPLKEQAKKMNSLRQKIENKLFTDKRILDSKQNIFKKLESQNKNAEANRYQQNKAQHNSKALNKFSSTRKEGFHQILSNIPNKQSQSAISEQNILQFESLENRSFYGFEEWLQFNKRFFPQVEQACIKNLWKIMRTINYGDIWIPSGLIFQVSKVLASTESQNKSLKQVFNDFLSYNNKSDNVNNFRELKNYLPLEEIQNSYCKKKLKQNKSSVQKTRQYSSLKKLPQDYDVFERAYKDSSLRKEKKNQKVFEGLVQKQIDQECPFKPKINSYCPSKLFIDETLKPSRVCHSKERWLSQRFFDKNFNTIQSFKAQPFDRSILQNKSLDNIPGVSSHLDRQKQSEAQRRKLQRYKQRPELVYRHD